MASSQLLNPLFCYYTSSSSSNSSSSNSSHSLKLNSVKIPKKEIKPINSSDFSKLLQSSIDSRSLQQGIKLHSQIKQAGFEKNIDLLPKIIKLYSICGRVEYARELFDRIPKNTADTFIWTSMISGYVKSGLLMESFALFCEMMELGIELDSYVFSTLLKASFELGFVQLTFQLHSLLVKCRNYNSISVDNSLINAYGSAKDIGSAEKVFERMHIRDIVSWSSMIRAYSSSEKYSESMLMFSKMQFEECIKPNEITIVSLLPACGFFSCLRRGKAIHGYIIRNGYDSNLVVGSSLITMYSSCGDQNTALKVFNKFEKGNVVLWTSMIDGFSMNGKFDLALEYFNKMQDTSLKPNHVTLVVILSACSHSGLIDTGLEIFETMWEKFGIRPRVEHYACVVDMLGRGGRLEEAEMFIENMSLKPSCSVFGTLLGACQLHQNVDIGERTAQKLFELEPDNATNYVILSNIYAALERWDDAGKVRKMMVNKNLVKDSGCSWIEMKDRVYKFGAHDKSHIETMEIYEKLEELSEFISKEGYVPSTKQVLLNVEEDDKRKLLCSHSERLAIAFGLLKAPPNVPIRIAKNLRVCNDCHSAIKLISKVVDREFIIRDTNRFHHFSGGVCSCGDYW